MSNIEVHSYDIHVNDKAINRDGDIKTEIQLWCFNNKSEPLLLRVRDFPVFCKIELPPIINSSGRIVQWSTSIAHSVIGDMKRYLSKKEIEPPVKWDFMFSDKLYYYSAGKKFPFILMVFNTVETYVYYI